MRKSQTTTIYFLLSIFYIEKLIFCQKIDLEKLIQFITFKPLSYRFEETIGFDVKASFASRPESRLTR